MNSNVKGIKQHWNNYTTQYNRNGKFIFEEYDYNFMDKCHKGLLIINLVTPESETAMAKSLVVFGLLTRL